MIHIYVLSDGSRAKTARKTAGAGVSIRRKMREKRKRPFPAARGLQTAHARILRVHRTHYEENIARAGRTGPQLPGNAQFPDGRRAKRAKRPPAGRSERCATRTSSLE